MNLSKVIFAESILDGSSFIHCNLSYSNLSKIIGNNVTFKNANLYHTILSESTINNGVFDNADMSRTNLRNVLCTNSSFINARIIYVCFNEATLDKSIFKDSLCEYVDFSCCELDQSDFSYTNICGSDFFNTQLHLADFSYAKIKSSSFYRAFLTGTNFKHSKIDYLTTFSESDGIVSQSTQYDTPPVSMACPEEGSFIGYKIGVQVTEDDKNFKDYALIKLEIPEDAKRSSSTGKKCRCNKARVLDIIDISSGQHVKEAFSMYDKTFNYYIDETVQVNYFDENRWEECSTGIHFFMSKDDAIKYSELYRNKR